MPHAGHSITGYVTWLATAAFPFLLGLATAVIIQIDIEIPKMPEVSYGYLVTYGECLEGKIFFEIFKEKREESLPIDPQMGIAFPMDGELTPTTHKIKYKKKGEKILRNAEFTFKVEDDVVDLCSVI